MTNTATTTATTTAAASTALPKGVVFNGTVTVLSEVTSGTDKNGNPFVSFDAEIKAASGKGRVHKLRTAMFHQAAALFPSAMGDVIEGRVALNGGSAKIVGAPKIAEAVAA